MDLDEVAQVFDEVVVEHVHKRERIVQRFVCVHGWHRLGKDGIAGDIVAEQGLDEEAAQKH